MNLIEILSIDIGCFYFSFDACSFQHDWWKSIRLDNDSAVILTNGGASQQCIYADPGEMREHAYLSMRLVSALLRNKFNQILL